MSLQQPAPLPIGPDLRAALVAMVKKRVPECEVEDVVQQTLADAFASPHAPQDAESFRRWIFGVCKNKVVDYHRRAVRETFEVPEVADKPAPHQEADLLRWAERNLPPGDENKATLDWMLREGEGEKLESIAETENVPAPRVRQRVSRLRRHLKSHWQKEVALLATLGVLVTVLVVYLRSGKQDPNNPTIAKEDVARAEEMRKQAFELCNSSQWKPCVDKLDDAKRLDPAGDTKPAVQQAREGADKALTLPPPAPTTTLLDVPPVDAKDDAVKLQATKEGKPRPVSSAFPSKMQSKGSSMDFDSMATPEPSGMPKSATPPPPAAKKAGPVRAKPGPKDSKTFDEPPAKSETKPFMPSK